MMNGGQSLLPLLALLFMVSVASETLGFATKNVYMTTLTPNATAEPHKPTLLVAANAETLSAQSALSSVSLQHQLEDHVTLINYQKKQQQGRVSPEMDAKYHQLHAGIRKAHLLEAFSPRGLTYRWQIGNQTLTGRSVSVFFNTTGAHTVRLTETRAKGGWLGLWDSVTVFETTVECRYVR